MTRLTARKLLLTLVSFTFGMGLAGCGASGSRAHASYPRVAVTVGSRPFGRPLPAGFVGFSLEYTAVQAYANPAVIGLIRGLLPGQRPVLRIGGDSTDETWWPQPGESPPRGARFALGEGWLQSAAKLAGALDARMIMGLNLAAGRPAVAKAEAGAFERGIGSRYIQAFEIGNEPDLYGLFPWYNDHGHSVYRRPASYSLSAFIAEFSRWWAAIGHGLPVAGPAYATFDWSLGRFLHSEPGLKLATFHHYPLDACLTNPSAPGYATIRSLLSDRASRGFADELAPLVAVAHAHHLPFRLDELNSASCGGKPGVSDTFASALWVLDTLFNLARVGVDGVNIHTFPNATYAPFGVDGSPDPEYYGMLMFTRAFPPGARLLPVAVSAAGPLKVWATSGPGGAARVVLINEDLRHSYQVHLHAPGLSGRVAVARLRGATRTASAASFTVPAASAVLVVK